MRRSLMALKTFCKINLANSEQRSAVTLSMSTEAAPVTEAPAAPKTITPAVEAPATPVVAPVVIDPATVNFHDVSADERDALLFNPPPVAIAEVPAPAEVPAVKPAPVETPEPVSPETPDPAAPVEPVVPVEPAPTAEEAEFIKNFRVHAPNKLASGFLKAYRAALEANPNANPVDIASALGYPLPQAAKPAVPDAVPGFPVATPEQNEIAALDAKLAELTQEGTLMTPELSAMIVDLGTRKATLQIRGEIAAQRAADQQTATRTQARKANAAELLKQYPTANDSESLLGTEIDRQFLQIKNDPNHPDAAMLRADDGPARLIEKAAATVTARLQKTLGLTEAQARDAISGKPITEAKGPAAPATPTQPAKPKTPAPVPRTVLVTAPGGKSAPEPTPIDPTQLRERLSNDPALRDIALGFAAPRIITNQPVAK